MKKYLQEWWTVYAVGISSTLIISYIRLINNLNIII